MANSEDTVSLRYARDRFVAQIKKDERDSHESGTSDARSLSHRLEMRTANYADLQIEAIRPQLDALPKGAVNNKLALANREQRPVIDKDTAQRWATLDADALKKITDQDHRLSAAIDIAANMSRNADYSSTMNSRFKDVATLAQTAELDNQQRIDSKTKSHTSEANPSPTETKPTDNAIREAAARNRETGPRVMDQSSIPSLVDEHFHRRGSEYRFKQNADVVAFKTEHTTRGLVIKTTHPDNGMVVNAMVDLAVARGWKSIEVTGSREFRQQAWIEAMARGREVKGYEPTPADIALLESRRNRQDRSNTITASQTVGDGLRGYHPAQASPRSDSPAILKRTELAGQVLEMGRAPYKHQPDEPINYYITLSERNGNVTTVWGKDLERAAKEINLKVGDQVHSIARQARTPVTVAATVRDEQDKVIGTEPKATHLNRWHIEKSDPDRQELSPLQRGLAKAAAASVPGDLRAQVEAKATERLLDMAQAGVQPKVEVYDVNAPSTLARESRSTPQPLRERSLNR